MNHLYRFLTIVLSCSLIWPIQVSSQSLLRSYSDPVEVFFPETKNPFPDMNIRSLSGKAAAELFYRGVVKGYADGTFQGENEVNRAEAAKFLLSVKNQILPESLPVNPFSDVYTDLWYAPYVLTAAELGVINGYPDKTFKPTNTILTAEFIKMLSIAFGLPQNLPHTYEDFSEYENEWFWTFAGAAQRFELLPHRPKKLRPELPITRNEMAVAIYQYLKNRNR